MEILLLIIFVIWCSSSIKKSNSRIAVLENDIHKLKAQLEINRVNERSVVTTSDVSSIDDTIATAQEVYKEPIDKVSEKPVHIEIKPIIEPVSQLYVQESAPATTYTSSPQTNNMEEAYKAPFSSEPILPEWIMRSLTGGRLFVTLGLGILFIGIAMLLKYTAQFMTFPIELRFASVALGAVSLMVFGHKQLNTRRDYGLYLFGGGLGILFLTVFTAFKFYALLSPGIAFILLGVIGLATFFFAILYDTMALAVLAITGGFLAPILTSTGSGSHVALFSYYLLLNLIIFAIAWKKPWRVLNSIGFAFTFIIGLAWGGKYYVPEFYTSVQSFLIIYFLLYVGIGVLFASRSKPDISVPIDAASIFGMPLIGFSLQLALTKYYPDGHTISSLALGVFYLISSVILKNSARNGWKLLSEIFAWLSVLFFTIAVPFAFDAKTTAPLWAMEGVTMLWMLGRSRQKIYGYAGMLLIAISNIFVLSILNTQGVGTPFANGFFLSAIILAIAHFLAAHFLNQAHSPLSDTDKLASIFSMAGMVWWFSVIASEMQECFSSRDVLVAWLVFYAVSSLVSTLIHKRFAISLFDKPVTFLLPAIILFSAINILGTGNGYHPLMEYGYISYAVSFAVHYYWLWANKEKDLKSSHVMAYITMTLLAGFELGYYTNMIEPATTGKESGWLLATIIGIILLVLPEQYRKWPITIVSKKYQQDISSPLILWATILCFQSFTSMSIHERYVPVFNLIDITEIFTIISLVIFWRRTSINDDSKGLLVMIISGLVFLLINCLVLRFMSNPLLPYLSREMFASLTVQTTLTILWTLMSMATMLVSSQKGYRDAWFAGAALLGVVIIKLFLVDLDGVGTISRIVSFMGVGLLTICLGYFSPIPAKKSISN